MSAASTTAADAQAEGLLRLDSVWKSYPRWPAGTRTLRALAARRVPLTIRRGEHRWALRDVSMELAPSASIGVIGRNGAGKSTLLRLASGLGRVTRGTVSTPPGAASMLTLADTFDASLSGRENALTAAVVMGWSRRESRALVPEILAFAELDEYADAPVRTYSDGMRLRLGFGVLAQLSPTVLLLDEVIAVGDLAFQAKCIERIREMRAAGTALVMASHDLGLVRAECDRAVWLEAGAVSAAGEAREVVDRYEQAARQRTLAATPTEPRDRGGGLRLGHDRVGTQEARIIEVRLNGKPSPARVAAGQPLSISISVRADHGPLLDPIVAVAIAPGAGPDPCFDVNSRDSGVRIGRVEEATISLHLDRIDLRPGRYELDVGLYRNDWERVYDFHWRGYTLEVHGPTGSRGVLAPPLRWEVVEGGDDLRR